MIDDKSIKILLVEDNPGDARLVREFLRDVPVVRFDLQCAVTMAEALQNLSVGGMDLVLLDLSLPDSKGWVTFEKAHAARPEIPIIVLTGLNDQAFAVRAIRHGAKDYLIKGQINGPWLARSIQRAIESQVAASPPARSVSP